MNVNEDELTEEEKEKLQDMMGYGYPQQEEKTTPHAFLNRVAKAKDTTKTGNLTPDEIGIPTHPIRTYKKLALIAGDLMSNPGLANYFNAHSEIMTSTSLSKDALLLRLAVTQTKQLADITPVRKENKGWFKKKEDVPQQNLQSPI